MAEQKTNVMRYLDQKKIPYIPHAYPHGDEAVDGETVAGLVVSAGKIGAQIELAPEDLIKLTRAGTAALTKEP